MKLALALLLAVLATSATAQELDTISVPITVFEIEGPNSDGSGTIVVPVSGCDELSIVRSIDARKRARIRAEELALWKAVDQMATEIRINTK